MAKREPLNVDDYVPTDAPPAPAPTPSVRELPPEEPQATLYLRCPLSIADRIRSMAFDLTKGRRKRMTQNDLLLEAVTRYLEAEGY